MGSPREKTAAGAGIPAEDYYDVLGCTPWADVAQIKAAFRSRAMMAHPDKVGSGGKDVCNFRLLSEAFGVLRDPRRRAAYDRRLGLSRPAGPRDDGSQGARAANGPAAAAEEADVGQGATWQNDPFRAQGIAVQLLALLELAAPERQAAFLSLPLAVQRALIEFARDCAKAGAMDHFTKDGFAKAAKAASLPWAVPSAKAGRPRGSAVMVPSSASADEGACERQIVPAERPSAIALRTRAASLAPNSRTARPAQGMKQVRGVHRCGGGFEAQIAVRGFLIRWRGLDWIACVQAHELLAGVKATILELLKGGSSLEAVVAEALERVCREENGGWPLPFRMASCWSFKPGGTHKRLHTVWLGSLEVAWRAHADLQDLKGRYRRGRLTAAQADEAHSRNTRDIEQQSGVDLSELLLRDTADLLEHWQRLGPQDLALRLEEGCRKRRRLHADQGDGPVRRIRIRLLGVVREGAPLPLPPPCAASPLPLAAAEPAERGEEGSPGRALRVASAPLPLPGPDGPRPRPTSRQDAAGALGAPDGEARGGPPQLSTFKQKTDFIRMQLNMPRSLTMAGVVAEGNTQLGITPPAADSLIAQADRLLEQLR